MRIRRSTMVNPARILELQPGMNGEYVVVLKNGTQLTLSRSYRAELEGWLRHRSERKPKRTESFFYAASVPARVKIGNAPLIGSLLDRPKESFADSGRSVGRRTVRSW